VKSLGKKRGAGEDEEQHRFSKGVSTARGTEKGQDIEENSP